MTAAPDPAEAGESAPSLPGTRPAAPGAAVVAPNGDVPADGETAPSPFLPSVEPPVPTPIVEPGEFDAKAMVESQKRYNPKPAYGVLPTGTEASREAAQELRVKAKRKRRRDKRLGWFVGVLLLGGAGAAGWFGYQAYQDEQDQRAAEREAEPGADSNSDDVAALTPLGEQVEVIEGLEDLNSTARPSAGAGRAAIDNLEDILGSGADGDVGDVGSGGDAADGPRPPITVGVVLPDIVLTLGERLPDLTGRETYVVRAADFSAGDPAAYARFTRALASQPQLRPDDPAFADFPAVDPDQIIIAVQRTDDELERAVVAGTTVSLHVDYTP